MSERYLIQSVPGGQHDTVVEQSELKNRQPATVAYSQKVPFYLSLDTGKVNRLQGFVATGVPTLDEHFFCQFDRSWGTGNQESLSALRAKGHSCFMVNDGRAPAEEPGYDPDQAYLTYGAVGTTGGGSPYNHQPGYTLLRTLAQIEQDMFTVIVGRPGVKYAIANFEYAFFLEGSGSGVHYWNNVPDKNQSFISPLDNASHTLQEIYNQGGVNLLNEHLHARRTQMAALWMMIWKQKTPGVLVTNGDTIPFAVVDVNGDIISSQGNFSYLNYESVPYNVLKEVGGSYALRPVLGGTQVLNGRSYTFQGVEADYYDFFSQYYYYMDVYCHRSDWADLNNTSDPAKLTLDYWQGKTWFHRHHVYAVAITYLVRKRLLELHAQNGGKDMRGYKIIDMHEHMYESNITYLCEDTSSRTYPQADYDHPAGAPFLPWITALGGGLNQKMYIHEELIWIRVIQDALLIWGTLVWWEENIIDYMTGKWAYFHQRSQEMHQNALDHIMVDHDIWKGGAGRTVMTDGIEMRYRQNGGDWTEFAPSLSPVQARWGTAHYRPFCIRVARPTEGKYYYAFFVGQEDTDVVEAEFKHGGAIYDLRLFGCMPATRTIREYL